MDEEINEDICGLCGRSGADKMAVWTGGGVYWPGESPSNTEFVHASCEHEERCRAHARLSQSERDAFVRTL